MPDQGTLPTPVTEDGRAGLAALLAEPATALIAVDFDGTLAPIVTDPDAARALPGVSDVLHRLGTRVAGIAVITGRPVEQALAFGELAKAGERLIVLGQYGAQRWDAATGALTSTPPPEGLDEVRAKLGDVLDALEAPPGTAIEDKGLAVAVHTRQTNDPASAIERLRGPLEALATRHGLVVERGRYVLELRGPGRDKGTAMRALIGEVGAGSVLFAGDDLGDLAAYDAVEAFRHDGGHGLLVCSASDEVTVLADRADVVVDGPAGVLALLRSVAERIDG